jgi:type IV pilus assembly protein PilW
MAASKHSFPVRQAGFGLAEILVGLAIGLVTTLVVMQVMTTFEGQKRTTIGGADAQTNGSIALFTLQRELQMAGFGLPIFSSINQPLNCDTPVGFDHDGDADTPDVNASLVPVTLIDGGADPGASDSVTIRSSTTATGGIPITVSNLAAKTVGVSNNMSCEKDDTVLIMKVKGAKCAMTKVTDIPLGSKTQITLGSAVGVETGASLTCLGHWREIQYKVSNNNLVEHDTFTGQEVPRVAGIVNIQAQYGISSSVASNQVTSWIDAGGVVPSDFNKRIKAVRIAVVARSGLLEKDAVTSECSSLTAASPTGLCAWEGSADNPAPKIDLSKNEDGTANPDWAKYRYRVFESVIPLRNVIWSGGTL